MQLECKKTARGSLHRVKVSPFQELASQSLAGPPPFNQESLAVWRAFGLGRFNAPLLKSNARDSAEVLNHLLRSLGFEEKDDYRLALSGGSAPRSALTVMDGSPSLYLTGDRIFSGPRLTVSA